jgi:hypothetical protein
MCCITVVSIGQELVILMPHTALLLMAAQETAINIGYACSLITDEMTQFQLTGLCADVDLLEAEGRVSGRQHAEQCCWLPGLLQQRGLYAAKCHVAHHDRALHACDIELCRPYICAA